MTRRVLVIDDEPVLRRVLLRALRSFGYDPLEAATAETACTLLGEHRVDAVLLDLHLGDLSGEVLYYTLITNWPYLAGRIVFVSGDLETSAERWPADLRACPRLAKPFALGELLELIAGITERNDADDANGGSNGGGHQRHCNGC